MQESLIQLLISMTKRREIFVRPLDGVTRHGIVNMIETEDGTGTKFNVRVGQETLFIARPVGSGLRKEDPIRTMGTGGSDSAA